MTVGTGKGLEDGPAPSERSGIAVRLTSVSKRYRTGSGQEIVALGDVSLEIQAGTVVGITGPSGSGKSTLLHVVGAMDVADTGGVSVGDTEIDELSGTDRADYRRTIGFVFQKFHLLPALSVLDNVVAPVLPYRVAFPKLDRARSLLKAVGLADRHDSPPSHLSGGEQQRVAIARALINDPRLLLADEPTGNLDSQTGMEIIELLLRFRNERRMTILIASHDPLVVARCDRIIRLQDGTVAEDVHLSSSRDIDDVLSRITRLAPDA